MIAQTRPLLLVFEDDFPVFRDIERLAGQEGFDLVSAASGGEALRILRRQPANLALIDVGTRPDVSELDLLRQIQRAAPACEVILMTAHAGVENAVQAIKLGARDYWAKPVDVGRLRRAFVELRESVERRRHVLALERQVAQEGIPYLMTAFMRALAAGTKASERDIAGALGLQPRTEARVRDGGDGPGACTVPPLPLDTLERDHIVGVLWQVGGNRMAAAKMLGISRRALYRRLDRYQIGHLAPQSHFGRRH